MKKIILLAPMVAIAICVAVFTSCKDKAPALPEGTPMGEFKYFEQTDEATGAKTIAFIDAQQKVTPTTYTSLTDHQDFIVATDGADGSFVLLDLKGSEFARCDSFKVQSLYAVSAETETTGTFIKAYARNGNKLAFALPSLQRLENVDGIKQEILPLANGDVLYKQEEGWGIANTKDVLSTAICPEIVVIITQDGKTYYWVTRQDFVGVLEQGEILKRMNAKQLKQLKRKATILWEEGGVSAILVKKI